MKLLVYYLSMAGIRLFEEQLALSSLLRKILESITAFSSLKRRQLDSLWCYADEEQST